MEFLPDGGHAVACDQERPCRKPPCIVCAKSFFVAAIVRLAAERLRSMRATRMAAGSRSPCVINSIGYRGWTGHPVQSAQEAQEGRRKK